MNEILLGQRRKTPLLKNYMSTYLKKDQVHVAISFYIKGNNGSWVK